MTKASKARLRELETRGIDAERIGHAVLDTGGATRELVCHEILRDLDTTIAALEKKGGPEDPRKHSVDDLLRAMDRQKITAKPAWQTALDAVIAEDKREADARRLSLAKARRTLQDQRDFETWKAQRTNSKDSPGSKSTPADEVSGDGG